MIKRTRLWALVGSSALLLGMMLASTGGVAANGTVDWNGSQGLTEGTFTDSQCADPAVGYIYWVFTLGGGGNSVSAATLHLGGTGTGDYAMTSNGGNEFKVTTPFFTLAGLTASASYTGSLGNGNSNLVISHGCEGTTETQPPTEAPTDTPAPTATPSFGLQSADITDAPSEPSTDSALGANGTSAPADGAWLLVVALGVLLASIVVLTPARAKSRR